ncbi:sn-glycerol-3-phosphate ABC transporter permease UgpE [Varunaivibrio sulfuroxidans]|uniref:sn-glycerol-3-phosphate transport system permease protein UgpE n=1 Tax=Varunaivibrio sulfuroxidans TaxID=1773489 RepID=A0A4R3JFV7_9PROT|nr:sn-glycerol-3-phosphate ABC transporter permease UgpE [Varunaivibrio sulfuroxidans]TCS64173.1 carbohydrate ABC transporter membrane protein 2 (CUT1 family) [Varunaivibrio sulfuroxidans]WES31381.1 sn-glycerol-3-phosphate ABC transporter permease UgpE [Varunaivibrio sulfuroxidans]
MVENRPFLTFLSHAILIIGVAVIAFPIYVALVTSSHHAADVLNTVQPWFGDQMIANFTSVLQSGRRSVGAVPVERMMINSTIMALGIMAGKIVISILSAFAVVYFRFPFRMVFFWVIFMTLMLPVEVRILPTYKVVSDLGLLDSFGGLTLPLIASATATFLFRQFFLTVPDELTEAARMDGAGPIRFFFTILLPLSRTNIAALAVILFIYGWNQYLWPLLITTQNDMTTVVMGMQKMIHVDDAVPQWNLTMATALLAMAPPIAVVIIMQRQFVKGLVESEK